MNNTIKASLIRVGIGGFLLLVAISVAAFVFPDAKAKRDQQDRAAKQAEKQKNDQKLELQRLKERAEALQKSREVMDKVLANMSVESEGALKWKLRKALHEMGEKHGMRIHNVKYGAPAKEGAKGTDLESINVELVSSGVYKSIKSFMLALEKSDLPFGISNGRFDEGPDNIRMTLTLRAFRRTGGGAGSGSGVGAASTKEGA